MWAVQGRAQAVLALAQRAALSHPACPTPDAVCPAPVLGSCRQTWSQWPDSEACQCTGHTAMATAAASRPQLGQALPRVGSTLALPHAKNRLSNPHIFCTQSRARLWCPTTRGMEEMGIYAASRNVLAVWATSLNQSIAIRPSHHINCGANATSHVLLQHVVAAGVPQHHLLDSRHACSLRQAPCKVQLAALARHDAAPEPSQG